RVGHTERADIVMAAEPLAQRIEAALAARRGRVADLAEGDDRLLGVGQRPDVGRKPVLEIVGLLQERHGPHPVGVTHGEPQAPFLYLKLGLPQHVELHGWDPKSAGLPQRGAVGRGVRDDQLQLTAPGRAVVVEDIVDVALQKATSGGSAADANSLTVTRSGRVPSSWRVASDSVNELPGVKSIRPPMRRPKRFTTITPTASNAVPSRSRFRASPWGVTLRASNAKYANTRNSPARLTKYTASRRSITPRAMLEKWDRTPSDAAIAPSWGGRPTTRGSSPTRISANRP